MITDKEWTYESPWTLQRICNAHNVKDAILLSGNGGYCLLLLRTTFLSQLRGSGLKVYYQLLGPAWGHRECQLYARFGARRDDRLDLERWRGLWVSNAAASLRVVKDDLRLAREWLADNRRITVEVL